MKTTGRFVLYLLSAYVVAYAIYAYGFVPLGLRLLPDMKLGMEARSAGLYVHIFGAVFALALGPLQFWAGLRRRRPRLHRWTGRLYLGAGVLVGGLAGLYISLSAYGGAFTRLGFACLALGWLYTGYQAYSSIRAGDVAQHRAWMVRNYALTLAAVTLRVYLPLSLMAGVPFSTAYAVIAWMCWVPNLLVAELAWNRRGAGAVAAAA